ncbi:hypothetical protein LJR230_001763 [Trinickia sp. LjRoot230]|uniref:hypothetical protein n=1 Tax=Trinickia sp. LjRoot230 TaxID=3342288 RepID=UPI003ECFF179
MSPDTSPIVLSGASFATSVFMAAIGIETRLLSAYAAGVVLGAGIGCLLLGRIPDANLSKLLGAFHVDVDPALPREVYRKLPAPRVYSGVLIEHLAVTN